MTYGINHEIIQRQVDFLYMQLTDHWQPVPTQEVNPVPTK